MADDKPRARRIARPGRPAASGQQTTAATKATTKEITETLAKYLVTATLAYAGYIASPLNLTDEQTQALAMDGGEARAVATPIGSVLGRTLPATMARTFVQSEDWLVAGVALWEYGSRVAPVARDAALIRQAQQPVRPARQRRGRARNNAAQPATPPSSNGQPPGWAPGSGPVAGTSGGYGLGVQHNPDI